MLFMTENINTDLIEIVNSDCHILTHLSYVWHLWNFNWMSTIAIVLKIIKICSWLIIGENWQYIFGSVHFVFPDPDAPSRKNPKFGVWHHWLVTNIPGNSVSSGDVMSEYVGAGPPNGTGLHRYVFLLFKQQGKQDFPGLNKITNHSSNGRPKWKVREFVNKYNLGSPIAGNFFQAEYDSYCEELYKQLKDWG